MNKTPELTLDPPITADSPSDLTVTVVIPTRNEAPSITNIIQGCQMYADELLLVDGNSTDGTIEIAESLGVRVVQDNGLGKGDALRVAIQEAKCDIIVFIDADGSHDPDDIPRLVEPISKNQADLVV